MHQLHLKRIAAVDRPCQEGATVAIMKRAMDGPYLAKAADEAALSDRAEAYLKRDWSEAERKDAVQSGEAMPGGGYPIRSRSDLKDAVEAFGRAKDKAKTKAHIITRARAIDATSLLPDTWKNRRLELLAKMGNDDAMEGFADCVEVFIGEMGAVDFDTEMAETEAREYANSLLDEVDEAVCSLRTVFFEINDDSGITDKQGALQESLAQFKAHIQGIIPEGLENAMVAEALSEAGFEITEGGALTKREEDDEMRYSIELKKSLGLAVTATDADVQKALDPRRAPRSAPIAILKMSGSMPPSWPNDKAKMPAGGKEAFADMSADERDKHMEKNPIEKTATEKMADRATAISKMSAKHTAFMNNEKAKMPKGGKDAFADMEPAERDAHMEANPVGGEDDDEVMKVDGREIKKSIVGATTFAVLKSQQAAIEKAADERAVSAHCQTRRHRHAADQQECRRSGVHAARHRQVRSEAVRTGRNPAQGHQRATRQGRSAHGSRQVDHRRGGRDGLGADRKSCPGGDRQGRPEEHLQGARFCAEGQPRTGQAGRDRAQEGGQIG